MYIYSRENGRRTMTRRQVRDVDAWAINQVGLPGVVLMENAGRSCAELIVEMLRQRPSRRVAIFCGTGNNGGDGYVIARHLMCNGCGVRVAICGSREKIKGDARTNMEVLSRTGFGFLDVAMDGDVSLQVCQAADGADMVVDAIFGTGLDKELGPEHIRLIEAINSLDTVRLAVDIPSGLDCDTGVPMPVAVRADMTVTFVAAKSGFACAGSEQFTGTVHVASIGIDPA